MLGRSTFDVQEKVFNISNQLTKWLCCGSAVHIKKFSKKQKRNKRQYFFTFHKVLKNFRKLFYFLMDMDNEWKNEWKHLRSGISSLQTMHNRLESLISRQDCLNNWPVGPIIVYHISAALKSGMSSLQTMHNRLESLISRQECRNNWPVGQNIVKCQMQYAISQQHFANEANEGPQWTRNIYKRKIKQMTRQPWRDIWWGSCGWKLGNHKVGWFLCSKALLDLR